jgi:PAS domain S-box-containing protein
MTAPRHPPGPALNPAEASSDERPFRALFHAALDAMLILDAHGRCLEVNPAASGVFWRPRGDVVGRTLEDLGLGVDGAAGPALAALRGGPLLAEGRIRRPDGTVRIVELALRQSFLPGRDLLVVRDVTQRDEALRALQQSEEWLERAQRVAHIGSWVSGASLDGRLRWSRECYRIFGVKAEEFDGTVEAFYRCVHPEDVGPVQAAVFAALRGEVPYDIEHRIVRPGGEVRWVHEQAEIVRDAAGNALEMLGTCQDVTERRRLEQQLAQAHKMEAVGRLAGGIAHDFNNLLTAVLGYSEILEVSGGLDETQRARVEGIRRAGERASSLTRQLLAFGRRQILQPRVFDLRRAVRGMEPMLRRVVGEDIELVVESCAEASCVRADASQVDQVLLNLVLNARDAMPSGGRLTVDVTHAACDALGTAGAPRGPARPHVLLGVTDTGVGMSAEVLKRLFEPFFTTKGRDGGTGLGLATAYGIVRQSGGQIRVASQVARGSRFEVYLPLVDEPEEAPSRPEPGGAAAPGRETVLLAEDEESIRAIAVESLGEQGYTVLRAVSGTDALAVAAQYPGPIDLLVTDVVMPGLSGPEVARRLRESRPGLPVLFMSGYADATVDRHGGLDPSMPFLPKPFTPSRLVQRVREVLDQRAPHVVPPPVPRGGSPVVPPPVPQGGSPGAGGAPGGLLRPPWA